MPTRKIYPPAIRQSERLRAVSGGPNGAEDYAPKIKIETPETDRRSSSEMAHDDTQAELQRLRDKVARLEAEQQQHRRNRETIASSAFSCSDAFQPTGMAAWPAFRKFTGSEGANPDYDRKEKVHANDPAKFSGDKAQFDTWVRKVADKLEVDEPTFRNEKVRMVYLMSLLEGKAE